MILMMLAMTLPAQALEIGGWSDANAAAHQQWDANKIDMAKEWTGLTGAECVSELTSPPPRELWCVLNGFGEPLFGAVTDWVAVCDAWETAMIQWLNANETAALPAGATANQIVECASECETTFDEY